MSDQVIAAIGRELARTLRAFARERREVDKKEIARLHTELCQALRTEESAAVVELANTE